MLKNLPARAALDLPLTAVQFAAGDIVFDEGEEGDFCYLVESGIVRISKAASDHEQETIGLIAAGEFFGELALYSSSPRSARATAVTDVKARVLDGAEFVLLRKAYPLEVTTAIADAGIRHLRRMHAEFVQRVSDSDRFQDIGLGLSMIAHDIRSPLATIMSAADLLDEVLSTGEPDPEQLRRYTAMIRRIAQNALGSADNLLAEVRGEAAPERVAVPVQDLLQDVSEAVAGVVEHKPVQFRTASSFQGSITCERDELVRALVNMVRNSLEALPEHGGEIDLRAEHRGDEVVLSVSDTGRGIPVENQVRIFEKRYTHGKQGGTGLGLHQVRRIVERHDGRIHLESSVGVGTTFRIHLPAQPDPVVEEVSGQDDGYSRGA